VIAELEVLYSVPFAGADTVILHDVDFNPQVSTATVPASCQGGRARGEIRCRVQTPR